jgi:hypothetical protein
MYLDRLTLCKAKFEDFLKSINPEQDSLRISLMPSKSEFFKITASSSEWFFNMWLGNITKVSWIKFKAGTIDVSYNG